VFVPVALDFSPLTLGLLGSLLRLAAQLPRARVGVLARLVNHGLQLGRVLRGCRPDAPVRRLDLLLQLREIV
jgi:hypothetical protein